MPRQSRGRSSGPSRPSAAPSRPSMTPSSQQKRPASTAAYPPAGGVPARQQQQQQQQQQQKTQEQGQPGLLGQMASTAAGVAIGSSIGHALGGLWSGGSSQQQPAEDQANNAAAAAYGGGEGAMTGGSGAYEAPKVCEQDVMRFRQCLDQNEGSLTICGWYLDQLKACQQAASRY